MKIKHSVIEIIDTFEFIGTFKFPLVSQCNSEICANSPDLLKIQGAQKEGKGWMFTISNTLFKYENIVLSLPWTFVRNI